MKETIPPVTNSVSDTTSVTYSCSPYREYGTGTSSHSDFQRPLLATYEDCMFSRQGDYWTIRFQGHVAYLKAGRGLHCLSFLLRHPGREFHVTELLGQVTRKPLPLNGNSCSGESSKGKHLFYASPILDPQAKAEYKRPLDDLRKNLGEAERFNEPGRAERAQRELTTLTEQLASAIGPGGCGRNTGSEVERARCAVTKRIRKSINKIAAVIPALGRHLASQTKTGYFCSYQPHPERPVTWQF